MPRKLSVLFLCVANSCRSQMAEGLARHFLSDTVEPFSAGTFATYVNPNAIKVMTELGIDISHQRSKDVSEFSGQSFDVVITVCDEGADSCPVWLGHGKKIHKGFTDPAHAVGTEDEILTAFRTTRDTMRDQLLPFIKDLTITPDNQ